MHRYYIVILFITILVNSCIQTPKPIIDQESDKITRAVAELILVQHAVSSTPQSQEYRDSLKCLYRNRILYKYKLDSLTLAKKIEAWHIHPILLDTFHANLLNHLNLLQVGEEMNRIQKTSNP